MSVRLARSGLRSPVNVTWEITFRCNLRCVHCLSDSGEARKDELSLSECFSLVDHLVDQKVFQVNIGGGEPFLREDFVELLHYAHGKGLVTCVSTNGTVLDSELARELSRMKLLYLQVSLDGVDAETNDAIRGKGTFRRIIAGMERLSERNIPFSINTVLTKLNFPQLDSLGTLAKEFRAGFRVSRFRPSGRAKKSRDWLGPDKHQLEAFAEWLEIHNGVRTGDSFFSLTSEKRRRQGMDMCGAAKMTCCISPVGNIYPCAFLLEDRFLAGNIKETTLSDVWSNARIFKEFRQMEVRSCENCYRFETCRGGCPAVAYHTYQNLSLPDPECMQCIGRDAA